MFLTAQSCLKSMNINHGNNLNVFKATSENSEPSAQVFSLGTPSTQMMYNLSSLGTGNLGKGKNLLARGDSSSFVGHLKSPRAAEGLQPAYSMRRSGQLQVWILWS